MRKGTPPKELDLMVFDLFPFEDDWLAAFNKPQTTGLYFIWGDSGNGKTSFTLKFIKELSKWKKVIYNSLEEGISPTMQEAFRNVNMNEVSGRVMLIDETLEELEKRLKKRRSAEIIVLDSWQELGVTYAKFKAFLKKFPDKLFIVISQVNGKKPKGNSAHSVMSLACLKIWVEGHRAISKGRYIGKTGYYINWIEGAFKYWGVA